MSEAAEIKELKERCDRLEGRVAALSAFALALLETHPGATAVLDRTSDHAPPSLHVLASLDDRQALASAHLLAYLRMPAGGLASAPPFERRTPPDA